MRTITKLKDDTDNSERRKIANLLHSLAPAAAWAATHLPAKLNERPTTTGEQPNETQQ